MRRLTLLLFLVLAANRLEAQCRIDQLTDTAAAASQRFWIFDPNAAVEPRCGRNRSITVSDLISGGSPLPFVGLTMEEVDGSPSVTGVFTLRIDQADGFVGSSPGAGIFRIDWVPDVQDDEVFVGTGPGTYDFVAFPNCNDVTQKVDWTGSAWVCITDTGSGGSGIGDYVMNVADGTGIDGTATGSGSTYTPIFDSTEVGTTTWGSGSGIAWTFNAGVTDPVVNLFDDSFGVTLGASAVSFGGGADGLFSTDVDGDAVIDFFIAPVTDEISLNPDSDATQDWRFTGTTFRGRVSNNDGPQMQDEAASATNPVFTFTADDDSGMGRDAITGGPALIDEGANAGIFLSTATNLPNQDRGAVSIASFNWTVESIQSGAAFPGSPASGDVFVVTDDSAAGACDSAAGSALTLCRWDGAAWVKLGDGGGGGGGSELYQWSAGALLPIRATGLTFATVSADVGTNREILTRAYGPATDSCAGAQIALGDIGSGNVTFAIAWYAGTATTAEVIWDVRQRASGEGESWDLAAASTETAAADTTQGTLDLMTRTSWTETIANLGWSDFDTVWMDVCRDADNVDDDMSGDALLVSFSITVPNA